MRKGSKIPYIYHPMEVALIVAQMTDDPEVIAAAYLHDVLEDTSVTPEELERTFGGRILSLVQEESEDKERTWRERKASTIAAFKAGFPRGEAADAGRTSSAICAAQPGITW